MKKEKNILDNKYLKPVDIRNQTIFSIFISIASTLTLVMALLCTSYGALTSLNQSYTYFSYLYASLTFAALFLTSLLVVFKNRNTTKKYQHMFMALLTFLAMTFLAVFGLTVFAHQVVFGCYFAGVIISQIISVIFDHNKHNIVIAILLSVLNAFLLAMTCSVGANDMVYEVTGTLVIAAISICQIIAEAFSKIHLKKLVKIIRKTYALEILLGLFSLVISFSFVFMLLEGMRYEDALWYCFSIVTTIGFGDITASGPIGKALTVILGLYGIVVVAVITSIIINFYNETKGNKEDKEDNKEDKE